MEITNGLINVKTMKGSEALDKVFQQTCLRQSIINQGDIHNHKKQLRNMVSLAQADNKSIPTQVWYDSLRDSDNGTFTKVALLSKDTQLDYHSKRDNEDYIRNRILTPPSKQSRNRDIFNQSVDFKKSGPIYAPFNASARASYDRPITQHIKMPSCGLYATKPRSNRKIETGSELSNGFVKTALKLERMK